MSAIMTIKMFLRRFGVDLVKYHSFWDDIVAPRGIKTIFDIGASDGSFARMTRKHFPHVQIYSFEPLHEVYRALVKNMHEDAKFKAYNLALGETSGKSIIHKSASNPSSSLLTMGVLHKKLYPKSAEHTSEEIHVERLDEIMKNTPLEKPVLVKIDVQGFEANVVRGGKAVLSQADIILVENSFVTLYEGQALFGEIHNLLASLGFSYRGRSETHYNTKTGEPVYEDSVFIKD